MSEQYEYDAIVIGGGPGGYSAAIRLGQAGRRAMVVEKEYFGGTCLNVGCIPTKVFLKSVEMLESVKKAGQFAVSGYSCEDVQLDLHALQARKDAAVRQLVSGVQMLIKRSGTEIMTGDAEVIDAHTVSVGTKTFTTENIILATGSENKELPIPISPEMDVLDSTKMLGLTEKPASVVVIGGGVIGVEFACFLAGIGTKVTIVEYLDRILPMVDKDLTKEAVKILKKKGVTVITGAGVKEITSDGVVYEKNGVREKIECEKVLMSVGRKASICPMGSVRLEMDKGAVKTDNRLRTSVPNIYAIGDVNGKMMLAHTAIMEAEIAVDTICGKDAEADYSCIPSVIFMEPEIASVGMTEEQAAEKYGELKIGKFPLVGNGKALVEGEQRGLIKVVSDQENNILGVHMLAVHASDMIAEAAVAMRQGIKADRVAATVHPHPTVSESVQEAMLGVDGRMLHM